MSKNVNEPEIIRTVVRFHVEEMPTQPVKVKIRIWPVEPVDKSMLLASTRKNRMVIKTSFEGFGDLLREMADKAESLNNKRVEVKLECPECQGTLFRGDSDLGDEAELTCDRCGCEMGKKGHLLEEAVKKSAEKEMKSIFE